MNQTEADSTPKDSDKPLGFMGFIGCMGLLAFSVCLAVIGSILNGWALSVPWGWFVVPTFNLPDLGIVHAFGLSMVINLFLRPTLQRQRIQEEDIRFRCPCARLRSAQSIYISLSGMDCASLHVKADGATGLHSRSSVRATAQGRVRTINAILGPFGQQQRQLRQKSDPGFLVEFHYGMSVETLHQFIRMIPQLTNEFRHARPLRVRFRAFTRRGATRVSGRI
jgi:hypothetical protein